VAANSAPANPPRDIRTMPLVAGVKAIRYTDGAL